MYRLGVDLGGTNIVAGLVDESMKIIDKVSCKTNLPRSAESIIEDIAMLCKKVVNQNHLEEAEVASVGVGVPGTANRKTGFVEYANNLGFDDVPFVKLLENQVSWPVYMDNDANAAAWGEYKAGGYKDDSFVMITLGTGIGGGVIIDGKLLRGVNYAGAELGHTTINFQGKPCNCGRVGCFEVYGSATALIEQTRYALEYEAAGENKKKKSLLWKLCGNNLNKVEAKNVFDAVAGGDYFAKKLLDDYTTYLAEGLANVINIFQPSVLCIGGGVSKAGDVLLNPVKEKTNRLIYSKNSAVNTNITIAKHDNDAGIIGAALLGLEGES